LEISYHWGGGHFFYDTQSVSHGQDTTTVLGKHIASDKAKAKWIKKFPKINGIENISHTVCRFKIYCSKNVYRILALAMYSSKGEVICSTGVGVARQYRNIVPDSIFALLVRAILK